MPADAFKDLLERAFAAARDAGKPVWNRMILSVLRNRLLQLTNRHFNVQDFGARSLLELVSRYHGVVAIDRAAKPVVIEWRGPLTVAAPARPSRVRPDLWRSVLDLSSGLHYEWDAAAGLARPVQEADPARKLPTVDAAALAMWRDAFASEHAATLSDPRDQHRLRTWLATAHGRQGLPAALCTAWSEHLKREVVARLTRWFQDSGYAAPDLFGAPVEGTID